MANPAVSNLSKRAPQGDRFVVTATLTWATYAQTAADKVTAASLGLVYITDLFPQQTTAAGTTVRWDQVPGASPGLSIFVEDGISGIEAEAAAAANTTVVNIIAFGY